MITEISFATTSVIFTISSISPVGKAYDISSAQNDDARLGLPTTPTLILHVSHSGFC